MENLTSILASAERNNSYVQFSAQQSKIYIENRLPKLEYFCSTYLEFKALSLKGNL
jgi:hypothetical protein